MKAYVRSKEKIVLSIGMIVKNEEKNLPRCLDSIKPLLDAVPCELIIADTGSTDRTVEIAREYTDEVFDFVWVDDFAKARDATIAKATGEWFMYLDADNWFIDLTDMIGFFTNPKLRERYNGASYTVHNFHDAAGKKYNISHDYRVIRNHKGLHFYGRIHEHLPLFEPVYNFKSLTHHTGYVEDENNPAKALRNIPLLERAIAEGDDDQMQLHFQLAREYGFGENNAKATEIILQGIALDDGVSEHTLIALRQHLAIAYATADEWEKCIEACEVFFPESWDGTIRMAVQFVYGYAFYRSHQYERAQPELEKFLEIHKRYAKGELDPKDSFFCPITYDSALEVQQATWMLTVSNAKIGRYEEALRMTEGILEFGDPALSDRILDAQIESVKALGDASHFWRFYKNWCGRDNPMGLREIQFRLMEVEKRSPEVWEMLLAEFEKHVDEADAFCDLLRLRTHPQDAELLNKLLREAEPSEFFVELIDRAIALNVNLLPFIERVDRDEIGTFTHAVKAKPEELLAYYQAVDYPLFPCALRWKCTLLERALFPKPDCWEEIFAHLQDGLAQLVTWIYGEGMPGDDVLLVIPRVHRFGLYARESLRWREKGDLVESLRMLARAGDAYPIMLGHVKNTVSKQQEELDRQKAIADEARSIEGVIKQKIRYMIHQEDYQNAQIALEGYAKLRPNDPELAELRLQVLPKGELS